MNNIKNKLIDIIILPLVGLAYILNWYEIYINGREPKSGQRLYKHKIVNNITYYKFKGLKNVLRKWKEVKFNNEISNLDITSMYPSEILALDNIFAK